jgi:hypothetical protein
MTFVPVFFLLNSFVAGVLHTMDEDVQHFVESIISLWDDYSASRIHDYRHPLLRPYSSTIWFGDLAFIVSVWDESDPELPEFLRYVAEQKRTPDGQIRAENFDWLLTHIVKQKLEAMPSIAGNSHSSVIVTRKEILESLNERRGRRLSSWEKTVMAFEQGVYGEITGFAFGVLYIGFHLLIIILSFTSLRAMPNSVYDTTWAKNIPSVQ